MTSACSSTSSIRKSTTTTNSTCSNRHVNIRKSNETICSSNSSCFLQKKKPANPLSVSVRQYTKTNSTVQQRVMSAKLVKLRNLQSQLNDANYHLMELAKENRALKTLQKRQDKALNNYEGIDADLPRLIKSHEDENRMLTEKNRGLKKTIRELNEQIKIKDDELITIRDQLKHLQALSRDKHLGEREKLQEQLEDVKVQVRTFESDINLLNRKHALELKNLKQKLNAEIGKHRNCQRELGQALADIDRLTDNKDRPEPKRRFANAKKPQSHSMVCLTNEPENLSDSSSELKLEPILRKDSSETIVSESMQSPVEKIKARLSVGQLSESLDKMSFEDEKKQRIRPHSTKLETIKKYEVQEDDVQETFEKCRAQLVDSIANTETLIDKHHQVYKAAKLESEKLEDNIKEVDKLNKNIKESKFGELILKDEDFDLVNKIWKEEYTFRKTTTKDTNGNLTKRDPTVELEDKKKLLATLRDIDNGKMVQVEEELKNSVDNKKSRLIKELFG